VSLAAAAVTDCLFCDVVPRIGLDKRTRMSYGVRDRLRADGGNVSYRTEKSSVFRGVSYHPKNLLQRHFPNSIMRKSTTWHNKLVLIAYMGSAAEESPRGATTNKGKVLHDVQALD
jgi:hypothetical protein